MVTFDEITETLQIYDKLFIRDKPSVSFRGVSIDSTEDFISADRIKKLVQIMSALKLNYLNWKIAGKR